MRVHIGKISYDCDKSIAENGNMNTQLKTHKNDEPYEEIKMSKNLVFDQIKKPHSRVSHENFTIIHDIIEPPIVKIRKLSPSYFLK